MALTLRGALGHHLEPAKTGRSRCRGCRKPIAKGVVRFGAYEHAYSDRLLWFHPRCAVGTHGFAVAELVERWPEPLPQADAILRPFRTAPSDPPPLLEDLRAGRTAKASLDWLRWWRSCRDPVLGELFARWTATTTEPLVPDVERTTQVLAALGSLNKFRLMAAVSNAYVDPRWVDVVHGWLESSPYSDPVELYLAALALLERCADPRSLQVATSLLALSPRERRERFGVHSTRRIERWAAIRVERGFPAFTRPGPGPSPALLEQLTAWVDARCDRRASRRADLRQLLHDATVDEGARLVLADELLQRGDLRGELLQLEALGRKANPQQRARRAELKKKHWEALVGALAPLATKSGTRLRDGLVVELALRPRRAGEEALIDAWEWAGLERLVVRHDSRGEAEPSLVFAPNATRLREVVLGNHEVFEQVLLASSVQPSVQVVEVSQPLESPSRKVFPRSSLPNLVQLRARGGARVLQAWREALDGVELLA